MPLSFLKYSSLLLVLPFSSPVLASCSVEDEGQSNAGINLLQWLRSYLHFHLYSRLPVKCAAVIIVFASQARYDAFVIVLLHNRKQVVVLWCFALWQKGSWIIMVFIVFIIKLHICFKLMFCQALLPFFKGSWAAKGLKWGPGGEKGQRVSAL